MNNKLKNLLQQLLRSPWHFPVEAALGVVFFIIAVWHTETYHWNEAAKAWESGVSEDILWLFVPLLTLSFWLQRVNRWAYYASFFLFLPLMLLNLKPFLWTYGFGFTYVLAAILLIIGHRRMDNRSFAAHALHVVTQLFFGLLITGILNLAVIVIVGSFFYIFGIEEPKHFYDHIFQFIWFVMAPQVCCTFIRQNEDEVSEPAKVLRLILNFILSPAVIIYTVILYTYFIKIVVEWDLPKGGVAWMVMGFITVALIGRVAQSILSKRHYDWFYRYFSFIAIPPLIMYWIGSTYRIRLYSFTESRFYLMVAGVLMTLFVLMLWKERTRRYQIMALIFGAAIILFTYIPGISAKSIGLNCQKQRLAQLMSELKLADAKTGKFKQTVDLSAIRQDSLLCEKFQDVCSVVGYVRNAIGSDNFKQQYGEWEHSEYTFQHEYDVDSVVLSDEWMNREHPLDVGDYRILLPSGRYKSKYDGEALTIKNSDGDTILVYPINSIISKDTTLLHRQEQLMTYHNDSLLLVLKEICINDSSVISINVNDILLFRNKKN